MKPLARWTIGNVKKSGFLCLEKSIETFTSLYDADVIIAYNCRLELLDKVVQKFPFVQLYDQACHLNCEIKPMGVAWKLYPLRIDISRHEIHIDNDIIFHEHISQIDDFFNGDSTLLLEDVRRAYGRFEKHVPVGYAINSGIYGMPPDFDLQKYFNFYVRGQWEHNALGLHKASVTLDEQGFVSLSLLSYPRHIIIPNTIITDCGVFYRKSKGSHFMGVNRLPFHRPFAEYCFSKLKIYL